MRQSLIFLILFSVVVPLISIAQPSRKILATAQDYFAHQKYIEAKANYKKHYSLNPEANDGLLQYGISCYYTNDLTEAESTLKPLLQKNKKSPQLYLYLARIYHATQRQEEAIRMYKQYLRTLKSDDPQRRSVKDAIRRCAQNMRYTYKEQLAIVENLGEDVNTPYDDFAPIVSPNFQDKIYFASARPGTLGGLRDAKGLKNEKYGHYRTDMFSTEIVHGEWQSAQPMTALLNSSSHDLIFDFDAAGQIMYFYKGMSLYAGEILVDTFNANGERGLFASSFSGPVQPETGDQDLFFFNDTVLLFTSRTLKGYGGKDIFVSVLSNGQWQQPVNLGPSVNSTYNESTPFLSRDGRTLYFSSNHNRRSMGGMDIFRATYNERQRQWTTPENLGHPVNSAGDEKYFRLSDDGIRAFFSSDRKDGYGGQDIYVAYFKSAQNEIAANGTTLPFLTDYNDKGQIQEDETFVDEAAYTPQEIEAINIEAIYYNSDDIIVKPANKKTLDKIASALKKTSTVTRCRCLPF